MARLIDADKIDIIFYDVQGHRGEYAQGYDDGVAYMASKIDHAPTVDAIPVEWLEAHKLEYLEDWGVVPVSVEQALAMWRKEQEAR